MCRAGANKAHGRVCSQNVKDPGLGCQPTVGKKPHMEIKNKKICLKQQVSDKAHETISFKRLTRFTVKQLNIND